MSMAEWTFHADTLPATSSDATVAESVLDALVADEQALGPVAGMNLEHETVGATFTVDAPTIADAVEVGSAVFARALLAAGVDGSRASAAHVDIELTA